MVGEILVRVRNETKREQRSIVFPNWISKLWIWASGLTAAPSHHPQQSDKQWLQSHVDCLCIV